MKIHQKRNEYLLIVGLLLILMCVLPANAELTIERVYPAKGMFGQDLPASINGTEFNANTRVAMALDVGHRAKLIGSASSPGYAFGLTVVDDIVYMVDGVSGFQIIDISNPEQPQILGQLDTHTNSSVVLDGEYRRYNRDVVVVGNKAYIADGENGLSVIDVSNPTNPQVKLYESLDLPGVSYNLRVVGNKVYVAGGTEGLQVIDISNPLQPYIIDSIVMPDQYTTDGFVAKALDVEVIGTKAYVAFHINSTWKYDSGLCIVDVAEPQDLAIESVQYTNESPDQGARAFGLTIVGDTVYLADGVSSGLQLIDITDPSNPAIIGSVSTPGRAYNVFVTDQTAYVADYYGGVVVINDSQPQAPVITGNVDTPGFARDIVVIDEIAYVAAGFEGLQVADVSDTSVFQLIGQNKDASVLDGFDVKEQKAYVADQEYGLRIFDISDPANPELIASLRSEVDNEQGSSRNVTVDGDFAYVADYNLGVWIVDIRDPYNPQSHARIPRQGNFGFVQNIAIEGIYAYVAAGGNGLMIYNISDPENPVFLGSEDTPGWSESVTLQGSLAYVADRSGGMRIIDVSNTSNPQEIQSLPTPHSAMFIVIVDDIAYLADGESGLQVIDISDLDNLTIIASADTPRYARWIEIEEKIAYIADRESGIQVIDIGVPSKPQIIGSVDTGEARCVEIIGDKAFVADMGNGFIIVPVPVEVKPVNVVSSTELSLTLPSPTLAGHYIVRVFDADEYDELAGAVTFSEKILPKVIIINEGELQGDPTSKGFKKATRKAYNALLAQGFRKEDIQLLNTDINVDFDNDSKMDDVDAVTNISNIDYAINTWAPSQNPQDLIVYLVGHGFYNSYQPNPNEALGSSQLDMWLDELQNSVSGRLVVIYDACFSGSFINELVPPLAEGRIVITSAAKFENAHFSNDGKASFSSEFWTEFDESGGSLVKSLNSGKRAMKLYHQSPWLDANGNGVENEHEDVIADVVILGRERISVEKAPFIEVITDELVLNGETEAQLAVSVSSDNPIASIWAQIIPPGFYLAPGVPVTNYIRIDFQDLDSDNVFEGSFDDFSISGTYKVIIHAEDDEDNETIAEAFVYKLYGDDNFEVDNYPAVASIIDVNEMRPQTHNFYTPQDEDWFYFYGLDNKFYTIEVSNLGIHNNVVVEIYDGTGSILLETMDYLGDPNADEITDWECETDGIYYLRIRPASDAIYGLGTDYDLRVYHPVAPAFGKLTGFVTDAGNGTPIIGAQITTNAGGSAISFADKGRYRLIQNAGSDITVTVTAVGYESLTVEDISIPLNGETTLDLKMEATSIDTNPIANIESPSSNVTVFQGETVNFSGSVTSGNAPFTYLWDFDGGATNLTLKDPQYVAFQNVGIYTVTFSVTDIDDDTDSDTVIVTVQDAPDSDGDGVDDNLDTDDDNDGLTDVAEQGPNGENSGYDGNSDDIPDRLQNNVASLHTFDTLNYLSLAVPSGIIITDSRAVENPSQNNTPQDMLFPYGFIEFILEGLSNGGSVMASLYLPGELTFDTYYKFGVQTQNPVAHWYEFLFDTQTGASIDENIIKLYFVDALRGDDILVQDGKIMDVGGPAVMDTEPMVSIVSPIADVTINRNQTVDFQGEVTGGNQPLSYLWDFDGGAANSDLEDPGLVTFLEAGIYNVTFTVTDADEDEITDTVNINVIENIGDDDDGGGGGGGGGCFFNALAN